MVKSPQALDLERELWDNLGVTEVRFLFQLVAKHSWWVSPKVHKAVGVVYPKARRRRQSRKEERGQVVDGLKVWNNEPAKEAFWMAQGGRQEDFVGYQVCHVYGREGVYDPRHFTNLANLTALPQSIASFSDKPPVSDLLRLRSFRVFGYRGPAGAKPVVPALVTKHYPKAWPHSGALAPPDLSAVIDRLRHQRDVRPAH